MKRRTFMGLGAATAFLGGASVYALADSSEGEFEIMKSEEEWRKILTEEQFAVMRKEATERAFTSPLNDEKREGIFHCAACDLPLFSSEAKFDSGTGWPSFWRPIKSSAVGTSRDLKLGYPRTEVHCARCGGHLGHIFNDGPRPTGKRHCINGAGMDFKPA